MAELQQAARRVLGRVPRRRKLTEAMPRQARIARNQHGRDAPAERRDLPIADPGHQHDHAAAESRPVERHVVALVEERQQQEVPRVLEDAADALQQRQVEAARERVLRGARDHHGDHVGATAREASREGIGRIAKPASDLLHGPPGGDRDAGIGGEGPRHRRLGHVGGPRHIAQGDRSASDAQRA